MSGLIAFCGLQCDECPAYVVTQADDQAGKERLLAEWRVAFNVPDMPIEAVTCDGCTTRDGRAGGYCRDCAVRACGLARDVANCAYCVEYETCQTLKGFIANVPQARANLEAIRLAM